MSVCYRCCIFKKKREREEVLRCILYYLSSQTEEEEGNGQAIPVSLCNSFFLTRVLLIFLHKSLQYVHTL